MKTEILLFENVIRSTTEAAEVHNMAEKLVKLQFQIKRAMQIAKYDKFIPPLYLSTARAIVLSFYYKELGYADMMNVSTLMTLWEYCNTNIDIINDEVTRSNVKALASVFESEMSNPDIQTIAEIKYNMKYNSKPLDSDFAAVLSADLLNLF